MAILAIVQPTFQPAMRIVSAITNASPAAITTTFDHDYRSGDIIRLRVPPGFGMTQANKLKGTITVTADTAFTIDIDTIRFDTFSAPVVFPEDKQSAQCVPVGEVNSSLLSAVQNVLPYVAT